MSVESVSEALADKGPVDGGGEERDGATGGADQAARIQARMDALAAFMQGATSFKTVASMTAINAVLAAVGAPLRIIFGLGLTEMLVHYGRFQYALADGSAVPLGVTFGVAMTAAAFFFGLSHLAANRFRSAFYVGMLVYAADMALCYYVGMYLETGCHALLLFWVFSGLRALKSLENLEAGGA